MARPNVGEFAGYLTAAGIGLLLAGLLFSPHPCLFGLTCRASIWDFFFSMGAMLIVLGTPLAVVGTVGRYLRA